MPFPGRGAREKRKTEIDDVVETCVTDARVGRSGAARADHGGVAETGVHIGDTAVDNSTHLHLVGDRSPDLPVSGYIDLVRDRFAVPLRDRDAELAELAEFCTAEHGPTYTWWQADAYAGKTSLMAHLVLHPPPGVCTVSFFVTARFADQADQNAYLYNVLDQLSAVVGQPVPAVATSLWPAQLSKLMTQAAATCNRRGERLVLVVDGLDEDSGVQGPGGRSIAALLPRRPEHGMRVVVCSRPNPQVPHDVLPPHPLHDPSIVRVLEPSADARAARDQAESELERLLSGPDVRSGPGVVSGRELVGFLTVARGVLTAADLAQLTGAVPYLVERALSRTVQARSFGRVRVRTAPGLPEIYGYELAHQELAATARRALSAELPGFFDRLQVWARAYQPDAAQGRAGWPADTPDYLFGGYFSLLDSRDDDAAMIALALDPDRHEWMFKRTGTNVASVHETNAAITKCLEHDPPDLDTIAMLAVHRNSRSQRSGRVPVSLPAVWIRLGQLDYAVDLAHSIYEPKSRVTALSMVAQALFVVGSADRARQVAQEAERTARSIHSWSDRNRALSSLARNLAEAGHVDDAQRIAYTMDPPQRDEALSDVARSLAAAGRFDDAQHIARSIDNLGRRVRALGGLTRALAEAGSAERAGQVAQEAEHIACSLHNDKLPLRDTALSDLARNLAEAGRFDDSQRIAHSIDNLLQRAEALGGLTRVMAGAGSADRAGQVAQEAEHIADDIDSRRDRAIVLSALARELAAAGLADHASQLAQQVERLARDIDNPLQQAVALSALVRALVAAGRIDDAEHIAHDIYNSLQQAWALSALVRPLAEAGRFHEAERIADDIDDPPQQSEALSVLMRALVEAGRIDDAKRITYNIDNPSRRVGALSGFARALVKAGRFDDAEHIAHDIDDPSQQAATLSTLAKALVEAGSADRAHQIAQQAEHIARDIDDPSQQAAALNALTQALVKAGRFDDAEHIAHDIDDPRLQAATLSTLAKALVEAGSADRAHQIAQQAEHIARDIDDPSQQAAALNALTQALVKAGRFDDAERTVHDIDNLRRRASALHDLAKALLGAGSADRASEAALEAERIAAHDSPETWWPDRAVRVLVQALVGAGRFDDAERTAYGVDSPLEHPWALSALAHALVEAGRFDDAERVTRDIDSETRRAAVLSSLARALVEAGLEDRASRVVQDVERIARDIGDASQRARVVSALAQALVEAGRFDDAERVARNIDHPFQHPWVLCVLAEALTEAGRFDDAERIAHDIQDPLQQAEALTTLTRALVEAGLADRAGQVGRDAEHIAGGIENVVTLAGVLAVLADSLVTVHSQKHEPFNTLTATAERVLARALSLANWQIALPALAKLRPALTARIARVLISEINGAEDTSTPEANPAQTASSVPTTPPSPDGMRSVRE